MIALHFRDSPADILCQPSIRNPGNYGNFGGMAFPLHRKTRPNGEGTDPDRASIDPQFLICTTIA